MLEVTKSQVQDALNSLDVQPSDGLLIHAALQFLGLPVGGPQMYLDAILEMIGENGTIAVPIFNFAFAKGQPYDIQHTPSQNMGVFSEIIRRHPAARRTPHPMQSLAVIGKYRDDLASRDTSSAFDPGSAFERMLELDFKLLLLGADVYAVSIIHYSEQRAGVPYRSWKDFTGVVRMDGQPWMRTYRMFVRDLNLDPSLTLKPVENLLRQRGRWLEKPLNYGRIASCRLCDFVKAADDLLAADPWVLVENYQR
jgi:aminoglycoside 3-N-acetyltransferase